MPAKNLIVIVVDGLRASALGTYGAAGCETPALDRLASQSFVFDQMFIDRPELTSLYRSYWQGLHSLLPDEAGVAVPSLPELLEQQGWRTMLLTDEPQVAEHTLAHEFGEVQLLSSGGEEVAEDVTQTQMGRLFAQAIETLEELTEIAEKPFCLWLHAQGMLAPWDGPLELRQSLADEEDPEPPRSARVPRRMLPEDFDPDELLGSMQSYAGQILVLDDCLAAFDDYWTGSTLPEDTLLLFLGARGFPLGEHRRVGWVDQALYGELLHVPLLAKFPGGLSAGFRSFALVQPNDLPATLTDYLLNSRVSGSMSRGKSWLPLVIDEAEQLRTAIVMQGSAGERAVRTADWHLRWRSDPSCSPGQPAIAAELFAKPDDRWEANEIAGRCEGVVASLQADAERLEQAILREEAAEPALSTAAL